MLYSMLDYYFECLSLQVTNATQIYITNQSLFKYLI